MGKYKKELTSDDVLDITAGVGLAALGIAGLAAAIGCGISAGSDFAAGNALLGVMESIVTLGSAFVSFLFGCGAVAKFQGYDLL